MCSSNGSDGDINNTSWPSIQQLLRHTKNVNLQVEERYVSLETKRETLDFIFLNDKL